MDSTDLIKMWKQKAVSRSKEIKELKKRIKENKIARDNWKEKYKQQKIECEKFKKEIESIKKKVEQILK